MRVTYLRYTDFRGARSLYLSKVYLFTLVKADHFTSINYLNDIASTNKVVKSVNGCLEVKYAENSMIINDNFKCLPLL